MIKKLKIFSLVFIVFLCNSTLAMKERKQDEIPDEGVNFRKIERAELNDEIAYFGESTERGGDTFTWKAKKNKHTNKIECTYEFWPVGSKIILPEGRMPDEFFYYMMNKYNQKMAQQKGER